MASSSATPPPYAVALRCRTRAPRSGSASARIRSTASAPDDRGVARRGPSRAGGRVRARTLRCTRGTESRSIYRVMRLGDRVPRQVPGDPATAAGRRPRWRRASQAAGFDERARSSRSPTAARARSTRCSPPAAVRSASATVTGPAGRPGRGGVGCCCPTAPRSSRWRAPAGWRSWRGATTHCARSTRGPVSSIAAAFRAGARRVVVGVGGSATTDGGLAAVEALGWSLAGARRHGRRATSRPRSSTPPRCTGPRRARPRRR